MNVVGRLSAIFIVAILFFLFANPVRTVPAGNVGVVDFFGRVNERTLPSGVNVVVPFARVRRMSVQSQQMKEVMDTPSSEGLSVHLEVSVIFHLEPGKAVDVYRSVGEDYAGVLLEPVLRSAVREVTSSNPAKALYSPERDKMSADISRYVVQGVEQRGITIERVLLRDVQLPKTIQDAIQAKLGAEQEAAQMEFVLQKERQEAERKSIEADGIAKFQKIVSEGISENLLRWKGIEATRDLAASQNAKVVVIGSGKDGLPIILGGDTLAPR